MKVIYPKPVQEVHRSIFKETVTTFAVFGLFVACYIVLGAAF